MKNIDAHCHLQFNAFDEDRDEVISRMDNINVGGIVVGVDLKSSKDALLLANKHENLYASIGLHPGYVANEFFDVRDFKKFLRHKKVVAIGECGLDYFREQNIEVYEKQKHIFKKQVLLAAEADLPLMIHVRPSNGTMDAYNDVLEILVSAKESYGDRVRGNVHFFVGGIEELEKFNAINFTVSVTGVITFTNDYDYIIQKTPKEMLLVETDAPYVAPVPYRGDRNEPVYVLETVERIAVLWGMSKEETGQILLNNTKKVFLNT